MASQGNTLILFAGIRVVIPGHFQWTRSRLEKTRISLGWESSASMFQVTRTGRSFSWPVACPRAKRAEGSINNLLSQTVMCRSTQQSTWSTSRQVDVDSRHGRQCTFPRRVYSRSPCRWVSARESVTSDRLLVNNQRPLCTDSYCK